MNYYWTSTAEPGPPITLKSLERAERWARERMETGGEYPYPAITVSPAMYEVLKRRWEEIFPEEVDTPETGG